MNYKTEQTVTDALRRAFSLGQIYWQQADSEYISQHRKVDATRAKFQELCERTEDTIDTLRAQLAEAQRELVAKEAQITEAKRDAERLDWIIEHRAYVVSDPDCCDGYWLNYARPDGTMWTQATEHETPRAAIDAAKGEPS